MPDGDLTASAISFNLIKPIRLRGNAITERKVLKSYR